MQNRKILKNEERSSPNRVGDGMNIDDGEILKFGTIVEEVQSREDTTECLNIPTAFEIPQIARPPPRVLSKKDLASKAGGAHLEDLIICIISEAGGADIKEAVIRYHPAICTSDKLLYTIRLLFENADMCHPLEPSIQDDEKRAKNRKFRLIQFVHEWMSKEFESDFLKKPCAMKELELLQQDVDLWCKDNPYLHKVLSKKLEIAFLRQKIFQSHKNQVNVAHDKNSHEKLMQQQSDNVTRNMELDCFEKSLSMQEFGPCNSLPSTAPTEIALNKCNDKGFDDASELYLNDDSNHKKLDSLKCDEVSLSSNILKWKELEECDGSNGEINAASASEKRETSWLITNYLDSQHDKDIYWKYVKKEKGFLKTTFGEHKDIETVIVKNKAQSIVSCGKTQRGDERPEASPDVRAFAHRFLYMQKYESCFPKQFVAILLDSKELAQQITLMSYHVFSQIQPREFFQQAWKQKETKWVNAPNICKFIEQYNTEVKWVQFTLLTELKAVRRGRFLLHFIDIALHCQKLRNYNTLAAIHSALTMNTIAKLSWDCLNRNETKKYEDFRNLFDNWKKTDFFDQQEKAPSPAIPYLALFCKQFFRIEELEEYILPDQSINYNKLLHLADRAERFRLYSHLKYTFRKKFDYQALLFKEWSCLEKITDDDLYRMSKAVRNN